MGSRYSKVMGFESTQDSMLMLDSETWEQENDRKRFIQNMLQDERQIDLSEVIQSRLNEYER